MHKEHSDDYKGETGIWWMANNGIGPWCDERVALADARLKGKQGAHGPITFVSY